MKKRTYMLALASVFLVVFAIAIVVAVAEKDGANKPESKDNKEIVTAEKNMTFGQCVSSIVKIRTACYESVKTARQMCLDNAANTTTNKDASAQCNAAYKKDLKECKNKFKAAKVECIKTTKPGFFEKLRYAFA
ncbi:MAG: hypothetical protein N3D20_01730 [Candidatus Pacearchaeota archaeon]|nr:hypothetical protein [Candidatus Pacearchaeota archaeon]